MHTNLHFSFITRVDNSSFQDELIVKQSERFEISCEKFREAASRNDTKAMERLFSIYPFVINSNQEKDNKSPLFLTIMNGVKKCKEAYEFLLQNGADPSVKDSNGETVFDLMKPGRQTIALNLADLNKRVKLAAILKDDEWEEKLICFKLCEIARVVLQQKKFLIKNTLKTKPLILFENHLSGALSTFLGHFLQTNKRYKAILLEHSISYTRETIEQTFIDDFKGVSKEILANLANPGFQNSPKHQQLFVQGSVVQNLLKIIYLANQYGLKILFNDPNPFTEEKIIDFYVSDVLNRKDETDGGERTFQYLREKGMFYSILSRADEYEGNIISLHGLLHAPGLMNQLKQKNLQDKFDCSFIGEPIESNGYLFGEKCKETCDKINLPMVTINLKNPIAIKEAVENYLERLKK